MDFASAFGLGGLKTLLRRTKSNSDAVRLFVIPAMIAQRE
jgi:hypothetical protein